MKKIKVSNCGECEVLNYDQNADWPSKEGLLKSIIITEKEKNQSLEAKLALTEKKLDRAMKTLYLYGSSATWIHGRMRRYDIEPDDPARLAIKEIEALEKIGE